MIDTLIIKIPWKKFWIRDSEHFMPEFKERDVSELSPTEQKDRDRPHLQKFILRKNSSMQNNNRIKIEVYEDFTDKGDEIGYTMRIEFSVSKLLFGNNLQETAENDLKSTVQALRDYLRKIEIIISEDTLKRSVVTGLHVGKNIFLPKTMFFREILSELSKTAISQVEDVTRVQHKNGNETLQLFSGVREYSFYNKIGDMLKTGNKAIDKSTKTKYERILLESYNLEDRECFRFEYRLKNAQIIKFEINDILKRPVKTAVTVSDVFSDVLWKNLLLQSWQRLIDKPHNQLALIGSATDELDLLVHILNQAKRQDKGAHSQNKAISAYGLTLAIKNHGVKMIKDEFNKIWSDKCKERFEEKINIALTLLSGLTYSDRIVFVDSQLEKFERITLDTLKREMVE